MNTGQSYKLPSDMFRALEDAVRKGYYSSTNVQRLTSPFQAYPLTHGKGVITPHRLLCDLTCVWYTWFNTCSWPQAWPVPVESQSWTEWVLFLQEAYSRPIPPSDRKAFNFTWLA